MNETTGVALDSVDGIHNGTLEGNILRGAPGIINNSFNFDGVGDYVNITNATFVCLDAICSISMWINSSDTTNDYLWYQGNSTFSSSYAVSVNPSGQGSLAINLRDDDSTSQDIIFAPESVNITNGLYQHIVAVFNDSSGLIYVNGTLVNQSAITVTISTMQVEFLGARALEPADEFNGQMDEVGIWNRSLTAFEVQQLFNDGLGLTNVPGATGSVETQLLTPNVTINDTVSQNFTMRIIPVNLTLVNATVWLYFANGTLVNNTENSSLSGLVETNTTINIINLDPQDYTWNALSCGDEDDGTATCSFDNFNATFTIGAINTSYIFNGTVTETSEQTFIQHINLPSTSSITGASFTYNGTERTATTALVSGSNQSLTSTFDIPLVNTSIQNFNFNITYANGFEQALLVDQQNTDELTLTQDSNVVFLNISFINETVAEEAVNASVPNSAFVYFIGTGTVNRSLTFSSTTVNQSYPFSVTPADEIVNIDYEFTFVNPYSQQREFNPLTTTFTNVTTEQQLFLLPTSLGLFNKFQTINSVGASLVDVRAVITRSLGGGTITVASAFTDGSGFVNFFLNPDVTYTAVFTKDGFQANTFTFVPTTELRQVIMGQFAGTIGNGTTISSNTTFVIAPLESHLDNSTDVLFQFNVTSTQPITFISQNITNGTHQFSFTSANGVANISSIVNTGTNRTIVGYYTIRTATEEFTVTRIWIVGDTFVGEYSFFRQFTLFNEYEFLDFIRILLVFGFITGTLIFLSTNQTLDTSESKVAVALLLIWVFSVVGWLNTSLVITGAGNNVSQLAQFGSQFGIAILSTGASIFFVFRRVFT